ncbi:MAG: Enoyl-CoA hydratase [Ilumatobacteraceae bacterium]|nr:Enoyl-CoA hydratase [Ilumatobacteraceae bacterium]MCU1389800.1 Enoyl-CoA hydratase [Ilumatobacteraceae bacterium]
METIEVDRHDGIVTITLNRPAKKNAATVQLWTELLAALREISRTRQDRVVIVTGAGGEFCAGADLWEPATDGPPQHGLAQMRHVGDVALALHRLPQPTIAKVRGVAVGAGCNLAFGCDLVVAGETARFSQIFSRRGLSLDFGGSWLLPRRVGLHVAKEIAFFGDILSATEAREFGLVNRVVADAELDGFVDAWATRLAAAPPIALAQTKRMLNASMSQTMEQALDDEGAAQTVNFGTRDTVEAISAFAEKRDPTFQGR